MLIYPSINEIREKVDSRYTLAVLAAKRARDLVDGKPELVFTKEKDAPVSIAAEEIVKDYITYKRGAEDKEDEVL
jgi:DNA-directed RNA polymerase subunit omega